MFYYNFSKIRRHEWNEGASSVTWRTHFSPRSLQPLFETLFSPINISHTGNNLDFSVQCALFLSDFERKLHRLDKSQRKLLIRSATVKLFSVQVWERRRRRTEGTLFKTLRRVTNPAKNGDDIHACFWEEEKGMDTVLRIVLRGCNWNKSYCLSDYSIYTSLSSIQGSQ